MKKFTTVALSAMLLLGLGATTLSADGHGEMKKDEKMMKKDEKCGAGKCGTDSKKDMGSMKKDMKDEKCGAGKCGTDSKKDMGSMKKDM